MSDIKLACDMAEQIKTICDKHGNKPGELINILHEAQHLQGYLPEETQRIIASKLGIPVSKVYGVVTFYTFFTMTPKGKHPISVCMGTACYVRGSEKLLEEETVTIFRCWACPTLTAVCLPNFRVQRYGFLLKLANI